MSGKTLRVRAISVIAIGLVALAYPARKASAVAFDSCIVCTGSETCTSYDARTACAIGCPGVKGYRCLGAGGVCPSGIQVALRFVLKSIVGIARRMPRMTS